jgi:hypothetical protein
MRFFFEVSVLVLLTQNLSVPGMKSTPAVYTPHESFVPHPVSLRLGLNAFQMLARSVQSDGQDESPTEVEKAHCGT